MNKLLETAQNSIRKAGKRLGLDNKIIKKLLTSEKIHEFKTDGYLSFRIQHNSILGPYKGGVRFHPNVTREEIQGLAMLMTIKSAAIGLNFGGAKGGIAVDPKKLTEKELEELSREYVRHLVQYIGPELDSLAPDVNTNAKIMGWMADEYIRFKNVDEKTLNRWRGAFTGKPIEMGGSEGREEATGRGGVIVLKALLTKLETVGDLSFASRSKSRISRSSNERLAKSESPLLTVAVQGFGNVGYHFAKVASEEGFKIIAVSDSKGAVTGNQLKPLDIPLVMECKREKGYVAGCYCVGGVCDLRAGRQITNDEILELPVDILVPAALENVINSQNMAKIRAKIIVEMANGAVTEEAYQYLTRKSLPAGRQGVIIVPDILANAGGVIVSYLEWLQNMKNERWSEDRVNKRLEEMMETAFLRIWDRAQEKKLSLKESAYQIAIARLARSYTPAV